MSTVKLLGPVLFQLHLAQVVTPFTIDDQFRRQQQGVSPVVRRSQVRTIHFDTRRSAKKNVDDNDNEHGFADDDFESSYQSSATVTKEIVSSLTLVTNAIFGISQDMKSSFSTATKVTTTTRAPTSSQELLERIRKDYIENNYLWTGKLDTSCFKSNCTFTDPTLSFVGVDNYIKNVGNLVPVVNYLLGDKNSSRSDLLNLTLNENENYIETRWNMVGELDTLFWKPKIDIIGRTKFWYQLSTGDVVGEEKEAEEAYQVYFYDEQWEIPAGLALLQLVTKAGTISSTGKKTPETLI